MVKSLFSFVFLTLIFAGKRCAFSSFSSYSHGADTHSAASAAFSSCSPVPAPSAFPENGSAYVPHKETAESHRRYVSRSDGRHAYIRLARPPEICGRVLHRLLLFLCRRSKQMIRAASAAITSSVSRIRSTPSSPRRNSETLRSTGRTASPALLFRFSTPVICSADSELFSSTTFFWTESGLPTIF